MGRLCLVTSCNSCRFCLKTEEPDMTDYQQPQTVSTDALATLGTIIDRTAGRDAIHLAVEPVTAGERLFPGQHVSLTNGIASTSGKLVGIVDPFLPGAVHEGQMFWLVVYPRQITSLRHVWEHPNFPLSSGGEVTASLPADPVSLSKRWIDDFAARIDQTPNRVMDAAATYLDYGDYTYDNTEAYKAHWDEFPEFWKHFEVVTGKKGPEDGDHFFTCSC